MQDHLYSFGPFALDVKQRVLLRGGEHVRLTPREIDVLIALVERHGDVVEKSRFFEEVWRGLCVEDCNLSQHVAGLRRVLGDHARVPLYIETVPRRGYRFVARVLRSSASPGSEVEPAAPHPTLTPAPAATALPIPTEDPAPPPLAATTPVPAPMPVSAPPPFADVASPASARPGQRRAARWAAAAVVALGALGAAAWATIEYAGAKAHAPPRSIAVLPFANLTGDAHQDRIAEALTRALMSELARTSGLRVEVATVPEGGPHPTGVDLFVETALLSGDGRVRVAAELLDVRTGRLIWAETLDSDPVSFLEEGARIAREIVSRVTADGGGGRAPPAHDVAAAQREYALAREYLSRRTAQVVPEALSHFKAAVELDPSHAPAHVGVAATYLLGAEQRVLAPAEALAGAEANARRALELDANLAEAHAVLGEVAAARWDFEAAEASYEHALRLDPSVATVHENYAALLTAEDRHDRAVAEARVARDLDPSCPSAATALAAAYYHAGEADAAIDQALAALRGTPRFAPAYDVLGWAYQAKGRDAEAISAFREAVRLSGGGATYVAALARAHARAGSRNEARRLLSDLQQRARDRAASPLDLAEVFAALGEPDEALRQVERAVTEGTPWLQHVDAGLSLAALHDHARFRALVQRMHHAPPIAASR